MDNKKQIRSGVILAYASLTVGLLSQLLITPYIVEKIGASGHGLYTLAVSVVSYLNLLSFGLGSVYIKFYAEAQITENEEKIKKLNGSLLSIFAFVSAIVFIGGCVLSAFCGSIFGKSLSADEISTLRVMVLILAGNMSLTFLGSVHSSYIIAKEEFAFQKSLALIKSVIQPALSVLLVFIGLKSLALVVSLVVMSQAVNLSNVVYCKFKGFSMKVQIPDKSLLRRILSYSSFIFIIMIIDQINWNVDETLLGILVGSTATSVYGIGAEFNTYFKALSTSISSMYTPMIHKLKNSGGEMSEEEIDRRLSDLMIQTGRLQYVIIMLVYTGFVFFGQAFIESWVGPVYKDSYYIALLILGCEIVPLIENVGIEIRRAKDKQKVPTAVSVVRAVANLAISIPLCIRFEGIGCAFGTAVTMVAGSIFLNIYYKRALHLDIRRFWLRILRLTVSIIPALIFGVILNLFVEISGYLQIFIYAAAYSAIYALSVFLFGTSKDEKTIVISKIKEIMRRRVL